MLLKNFFFLSLLNLLLQVQCNYVLVWSDEFNGNSLNTSNWNIDETSTVYNNELEAYTADNVNVANGTLILTAQSQSYGGQNYTSGSINSQNKIYFFYGKIEASIKLPIGQGFWPAFWLLPQIFPINYTEIDIMEAIGELSSQTTGTCYPGGSKTNPQGWQGINAFSNGNNFYNNFHTYGVEWTSGNLNFYVDGVNYFNCSKIYTNSSIWSLDGNLMYIIFNLAVGGNDPGAPDDTTPFPSSFYVDWVRLYQVDDSTNSSTSSVTNGIATNSIATNSSFINSSTNNATKSAININGTTNGTTSIDNSSSSNSNENNNANSNSRLILNYILISMMLIIGIELIK